MRHELSFGDNLQKTVLRQALGQIEQEWTPKLNKMSNKTELKNPLKSFTTGKVPARKVAAFSF